MFVMKRTKPVYLYDAYLCDQVTYSILSLFHLYYTLNIVATFKSSYISVVAVLLFGQPKEARSYFSGGQISCSHTCQAPVQFLLHSSREAGNLEEIHAKWGA